MSIALVHLLLWALVLPAVFFTLVVVLGQRLRGNVVPGEEGPAPRRP